ncbi:hypothetical protein EV651_10366 [Kribbella sp. VKM Ac-2571]|uniref:hypothetical protein n=1 Tax=Kribbella sp. VKM Ac-2571 TaxID=2512222 RepID=UPI00105F4813|nr:hypothetical protein [Kribbella sp. VKM Ac-2571]TDO67159.1 hypothetical protein EV651_10366 [Kribbella sp. VKM Ac-2571]
MDERSLAVTRRSLHGVAELLLAGPQHREGGGLRLRVVPGGFSTLDGTRRVEGELLVAPTQTVPLAGTYVELAAAVGIEACRLDHVYSGGPKIAPEEQLEIDPAAARLLADAFTRGDAALRALAPEETPVLWPEHFDVGITVAKVNYGVSPGDNYLPEPYAYIGPWTPRTGDFWNAPFGAAHPLAELPDVVDFFRTAQSHLLND